MLKIARDRQIVAGRTVRRLLSVLVWAVAPSFCLVGQGQPPQQTTGTQLQDDVSTLKKDLKTLDAKQQQIIDELNDLKRLIVANPSATPGPRPPAPPSTLSIQSEIFRGDKAASVAIVEYADFECPYCGQFERTTFLQILSDYIQTGKVKYFYRDLPLDVHSHAIPAARAARCAGEQDKFWEMHDSLFANQGTLADRGFADRAQQLGLDTAKFSECLSSDKFTREIKASAAEAQSMGIKGTPTFFLGTVDSTGVVKVDKTIVGAAPFERFKAGLDALLAPREQ